MSARWVCNDGGFRYIFAPNGGKRPFYQYVIDAYGRDLPCAPISSHEIGKQIKAIVTQDDPFAEILLNLWERDLL